MHALPVSSRELLCSSMLLDMHITRNCTNNCLDDLHDGLLRGRLVSGYPGFVKADKVDPPSHPSVYIVYSATSVH